MALRRFFFAYNKGITAVISEPDAGLYGTIKASGGDPFKGGVSVFTFYDEEAHLGLRERCFLTGELTLLSRLMRPGRGNNREFIKHSLMSVTGWDGFVPFTSEEHRLNPDGDWPKYITTIPDFLDKFGFVY